MNRYIKPLIACTLVGFSQLSLAQAAKTPLSLPQCIELALRSNSSVLSAGNSLKLSKSRIDSVNAGYLPKVSLQGNLFTGSSGELGVNSTTDASLTASISIYDGGFREEKLIQARHGVTQSQSQLIRTRQTTIYNVSTSYYELLRSRELVDVAKSNVSYNEALMAQITSKAQEGAAADVDVLPVEAQAASARVSLLSAENQVRVSLVQLQNTMGLGSQPGFDVAPAGDIAVVVPESLSACLESAQSKRTEIVQLAAAAAVNRSSVRQAKLAMLPIPTVTGSYQSQLSGSDTLSGATIMGTLSIDLYSGGSNQAAYRQAQLQYEDSLLTLEQQKRDIGAEVEQAYLNLQSTRERIDAARLSLSSAERNYAAQKERYSQGIGTTLDLLNAESQVVSAQSSYVQARYDHTIASVQLKYAVGDLGENNEEK
ncbi:MAG: TolC family protein [Armatimonadota bacterium]